MKADRKTQHILLRKIGAPKWAIREATTDRLELLRSWIIGDRLHWPPSVRALGRGKFRAVSGIELIEAYRGIQAEYRVLARIEPDFGDETLNDHHDILEELNYLYWEDAACRPSEKAVRFALARRHTVAFNERREAIIAGGQELPDGSGPLDISRFDRDHEAQLTVRYGEALLVLKERFSLNPSCVSADRGTTKFSGLRLTVIQAVESKDWQLAGRIVDAIRVGRDRDFFRMREAARNEKRRAEEDDRYTPADREARRRVSSARAVARAERSKAAELSVSTDIPLAERNSYSRRITAHEGKARSSDEFAEREKSRLLAARNDRGYPP